MIRVLVADDHPLVREGLRAAFAVEDDLVVCGTASDGAAAVRLCRELAPDVVLMDLSMPVMDGLAALRIIVAESPCARVLVFSAHGDQTTVRAAMAAGACGYALKGIPASDLADAVRAVRRGETVLSPPDLAGMAGLAG